MNVERDVLAFATSLLQTMRETERAQGWESGELLRTTLRLLVVAGADAHGWDADELTDEVRDLIEAVGRRDAGARAGLFDGHAMTVRH
ncbi:hypothetical protein [Azospirillum doebereinerae]|uniref:hypothetical protein n=1 Tax=Azospirillum doebereinerae TaxID=92933 RepID=UPI00163CF5C5|nr:hypothetical protein [Azospirillum doebereinerae]